MQNKSTKAVLRKSIHQRLKIYLLGYLAGWFYAHQFKISCKLQFEPLVHTLSYYISFIDVFCNYLKSSQHTVISFNFMWNSVLVFLSKHYFLPLAQWWIELGCRRRSRGLFAGFFQKMDFPREATTMWGYVEEIRFNSLNMNLPKNGLRQS